jgi:hypothetical protein
MGGSDENDNLVELTPEEHYLAHLLLVKIHHNNHKLVYAANMMCMGRNNKRYGWLRRKLSESMTGRLVPEETKHKLSVIAKQRIEEYGHPKGMLGKNHTEESKQLMSSKRLGEDNGMWGKKHTECTIDKMRKPKTEEHRKKLSLSKSGKNHPNFGKKLSDKTKQKISKSNKNAPNVVCPHCGTEGKKSPMIRWHFDNCRKCN